LCFGCGRLEECLDLAIPGSPDGLDDRCNHQTIAESRFFAKINFSIHIKLAQSAVLVAVDLEQAQVDVPFCGAFSYVASSTILP
jgi:hypothetical protein